MKILYTTQEGGILKPFEIKPDSDKEIFAIYLPDGTIWDTMIGVDDVTKITPDEFEILYNRMKLKEEDFNA
jgi:hypothetical protein